jgi:NAD(P)H-hydrate epimerase
MQPIVTPDEMAAIDAAAPVPVDVLIARAGAAVARRAREMLGGAYGRRVVVVAGKGNNGADGRAAAAHLERRGVRVEVIAAPDAAPRLPAADLVIDAAYGTGFRGDYDAPDPGTADVLAVDIPSGVDATSGELRGSPLRADSTVTFAALKPGLVLEPGRSQAGAIHLADIGLDVSCATAALVERSDVATWLPARDVDAHKWKAAVLVVAGSPGMAGAAALAAGAAQRAGAGMVRLGVPGVVADPRAPIEVVAVDLPALDWTDRALELGDRCHAFVVGPGLGLDDRTQAPIRELVAAAPVPIVVDGDGLTALGNRARDVIARRTAPTILTPHDGEYERLAGATPGGDRFDAVRRLARDTGAVVVLKGATPLVAEPNGTVHAVTTGDERLATAGTGDVLSGIIGALLARGCGALQAASAGAWLLGRAAELAPSHGMVSSDLLDLLPPARGDVEARR